MRLCEYAVLAVGSPFVILDPIATIPVFLAMAAVNTPAERLRMARVAGVVAGLLLRCCFAGAGRGVAVASKNTT